MDNDVVVFVFGQAFGIVALICTVVSMQLKKKKSLMILQTASEAFIVAQYWVTGAFTGSLLSMVSFVRDAVFTKYHYKRTPLWVLLLLYFIMTVLTAVSWAGPLSVLPYVGSLVYAFTLWYGKVKWIRFGNAIGNFPYLFYTLLTGNSALFIMTLIEVVSSAVGFFRLEVFNKGDKIKKTKK